MEIYELGLLIIVAGITGLVSTIIMYAIQDWVENQKRFQSNPLFWVIFFVCLYGAGAVIVVLTLAYVLRG